VDGEGLPWRPQTVSELLDSAVAVLRHRPRQLLAVAVVLAAVEQLVLYPLRESLSGGQHNYIPDLDGMRHHLWIVIAAGMGTEAFVIGLLGAVAAGPARSLLLASAPPGVALPPPQLPPPRWPARLPAAIALSLVVGSGAFVAFWAGAVGWIFWFMLTALVTPVLVNDAMLGSSTPWQPGRKLSVPGAFGRSFALVGRSGLRPGAVRLMAYGVFTLIRLLIAWVGLREHPGFLVHWLPFEYAVWVLVNAVMYAYLACGDAAAHLETRIRLEGLDIELSRAVRLGTPIGDALAVPR
jgi:hypothetical protein